MLYKRFPSGPSMAMAMMPKKALKVNKIKQKVPKLQERYELRKELGGI